jgi:hypothetical protein
LGERQYAGKWNNWKSNFPKHPFTTTSLLVTENEEKKKKRTKKRAYQ